jgi:hypothetical protein
VIYEHVFDMYVCLTETAAIVYKTNEGIMDNYMSVPKLWTICISVTLPSLVNERRKKQVASCPLMLSTFRPPALAGGPAGGEGGGARTVARGAITMRYT